VLVKVTLITQIYIETNEQKNKIEVSVPSPSFSALLDTTDGLSAEGSIPACKNCNIYVQLTGIVNRVQQIFLFLKKMKNTDPVMHAKLKSKTHLQNMFFNILSPFFMQLASKFEKSANMT